MTKRRDTRFRKIWRFVRDLPYWIRCHTYNRYHIVDCRNAWYKWGWQDVSELMLYSSFELLRRFVENEDGLESLYGQGDAIRRLAESDYISDENKAYYLEDAKQR